MKNWNCFFAVLMASALLGACASQPSTDLSLEPSTKMTLADKLREKRFVIEGPANRISNFRLSGWNYVDDYHVILTAGVRDHYLVTLRSYCYNLDGAFRIGFTSTIGSLTTSDVLLVESPGGRADRCTIRSIDRLSRIESK
ncbi:MAG: hypothetical protein HKO64_00265 [Xanthomonadales bacterium]|nr:hypothetical protein [Gammaproteobacteria bacterium]NNE04715.1 hypothetical protein [Xanthomonadales bacterium]NNL94028.1 hypothetical protein [Xanthomonadales bacterium]